MTDLELLLSEQQQRIEHLENVVSQLVEYTNEKSYKIEMLSKQVQMLAKESGVSIQLGFLQ